MTLQARPGRWRSSPSFPLVAHVIGSMWVGALVFAGSSAAETVGRGDQIAATCASCHGLDRSGSGIPVINGLDEQKIIDAMRAYGASRTPSHVMHAVALSLSEDELLAVARAVAARGPTTP